jgi:uncharacterized protein YfdQ (DUF2303 family)
MFDTDEEHNIADSILASMPTPNVLTELQGPDRSTAALAVAVPSNFKLETIDLEKYRANPTRADGTARFSDVASFLAYVGRHGKPGNTVVWCDFNPKTAALSFAAVFDDHAADAAGWRKHRATFSPAPSIEWERWKGGDKKQMSQVEFALFIEDNAADITGTPTEADMLKMATEFEVRQDMKLKSAVRLQSGGVRMEYIDTDDAATVQQMQVFDKFHILIPVFFGSTVAEGLIAKLRYRQQQGVVHFWYELQRPDKAHKAAAEDLIGTVRSAIGELPLLMGAL